MHVTIEHLTTTSGMFSKSTKRSVRVTVIFSELEKLIIEANEMKNMLVLPRKKPYSDDDADILIATLLTGPNTWEVNSTGHAKNYAAELVAAIHKIKEDIDFNREIDQPRLTFEL